MYTQKKDWLVLENIFLCSSSLPLASTRRVQSTFSSYCPLKAALLINLRNIDNFFIKSWEHWESNPGQMGLEPSTLTIVLCSPQPPDAWRTFSILVVPTGDGCIAMRRTPALYSIQ